MSPRAEDYQKKAEEAEAKAATSRAWQAKQTYLELARHWRELAEQASQQND